MTPKNGRAEINLPLFLLSKFKNFSAYNYLLDTQGLSNGTLKVHVVHVKSVKLLVQYLPKSELFDLVGTSPHLKDDMTT